MSVAKLVPKPKALSGYQAEMARRHAGLRRDFLPMTTVVMEVPNYNPDAFYASVSKEFGKQYEKEQAKIEREKRKVERLAKKAEKARKEAALARANAAKEAASASPSVESAPVRQSAEIHAFIAPEGMCAAPWEDVPPISDEEAQRFAAR